MEGTARAVLVGGSIVFLLGLTAAVGGAAPVAADPATAASSPLPASPPALAKQATLRVSEEGLGLRAAIELIVLALTCSVAVAFYSATAGERGATRVPARVRRR